MTQGTESARPPDTTVPLAGRTVVVTRTLDQSAALADPLTELGAEVLAFPVIRVVEPEDWAPADRAIAALAEYDWVILTSTNAVDRFVARLEQAGPGVSALADTRIAVVGSGTKRRLAEFGLSADLMPAEFRGEGLIESFRELGAGSGWRILIPRALDAREIVPDSLREMGAQVDVVPVYRTVRAQPDLAMVGQLQAGKIDLVTFTSPSTFVSFISLVQGLGVDVGTLMRQISSASIGPVTSDAMRERGFEPTIEAQESTVPGLVAAIEAHYTHG